MLAQHGDHTACALRFRAAHKFPDIVIILVVGEKGVIQIGEKRVVGGLLQSFRKVVDPDPAPAAQRSDIALYLCPALCIHDVKALDKFHILRGKLDLLHGVAVKFQMLFVPVYEVHLCHTGGAVDPFEHPQRNITLLQPLHQRICKDIVAQHGHFGHVSALRPCS